MKKLTLNNKINPNIQKLSQIFPNVIKEGKVDFELLKQLFSDTIIDDCRERYGLNWVGKKEALLKTTKKVSKTLRPIKEKSLNFDTTKNLYIEGDNFEVLKIIEESYLNKIKMIYIDPPYNTGKDFIYKDNFTKNKDEFLEEVEAIDDEGIKLYKNIDTNGRFHSDWLSMMYERLIVARDLLREDGVIFISIDDNEVHNLRHICDEVFGEGNFVGEIIRKTKSTTADKKTGLNLQHENLIIYAKNLENVILKGEEKDYSNYKNPDNDPNGEWVSGDPTAKSGNNNLRFEIINPFTNQIDLPPKGRYWAFSKETFKNYIEDGKIVFKKDYKENERGFIFKRYKKELKSEFNSVNSLFSIENDYMNQKATKEIKELFDNEYFENPKPINFIKKLIKYTTSQNDIILDFFSGSATTAHAVMELNAEDGGERQFIMVQIPEATDEKSEAYKNGYKTICDIGRERIIRAGKKISDELLVKSDELKNSELNTQNSKLDIGFRYFKTDSSNFKELKDIQQFTQNKLFEDVDNIKPDRNDLDLLFEIILNLGLELNLEIELKEILGKKVYFLKESAKHKVEYNSLIACFDNELDEKLAHELKVYNPLKIVLKDNSFISDSEKINFEEVFKDTDTDVWVV